MADINDTLKRVKSGKDYRHSEENQEYISGIEKELESLKSQEGFLKIDYIVSLRKKLKSVIVAAKLRLLEEDDLEKRQQIKADIKSFQFLLPFFARNVDKEYAEIEQKLQEML